MAMAYSNFDVSGRTVAITGAAGVLCGAMAVELAALGARVAVMDIREDRSLEVAGRIRESGGDAFAISCDVTDPDSVRHSLSVIRRQWNHLDVLINGAGGNHPGASTSKQVPFFDLDHEAVQKVFGLNLIGTFLPCQVFGKAMAERGQGVIVNIASMNSIRPLTRVPAYSAAKAAVANFTQWLAVYMAHEHGPNIRVNAIAPGFFMTEQVRFLFVDPQTGAYTERGEKVVAHTPMRRFGAAQDLLGTLVWLISPASAFVTGVVIPVDGGFSAFSGV